MRQDSFYGLGIAPNIITVLDRLRFATPTPIQKQSIPVGIEGKDLVGIAQTGTGKTLAFGVPMIQAVLGGGQGFIVLPTRELAHQVDETLRKVGGPLGVRTALLIGGGPMGRQVADLRGRPAVVIGTPGRIIDHLEQGNLRLERVSMLVLDEADRMLDMGFAPQLRRILERVPKERQTMLFSATMPDDIVRIANRYMRTPVRVEIARSGTTAEGVTQELYFVALEDKPRLLEKILSEYHGSVLIFARTKRGAKRVMRTAHALGHAAAEFHSNKSLGQRREALDGFRNGKYRVLAATDIAARGLDVKGIELVINYDLPMTSEDYVHRIGRTARAGAAGHAISFATPDQHGAVRGIERLIRIAIPRREIPADLPPRRAEVLPHRSYELRSGSRSGGGRRPPPRGRGGFGGAPGRSGSGRPGSFRRDRRPRR